MCIELTVYATTDNGKTPYPGMPERVKFEVDKFTKSKPTCTCWISDKDGDGKILRQTFVEEVLRDFLANVSYGNIVIEIR